MFPLTNFVFLRLYLIDSSTPKLGEIHHIFMIIYTYVRIFLITNTLQQDFKDLEYGTSQKNTGIDKKW